MVKIGIEIHQRLDTKKLFCDCQSTLSEDEKPLSIVKRTLHPVFSELGEVDEASQAEFAKGRQFEYQTFHSNDCLIELDEEPPKTINMEALKIALVVAMHLNATPLNEVHIMRKMVIDGSNTSGFQRTAIVAMNGHLDTSRGTVHIPIIAIEEESAGIVSNSESKATYRLDRLGIPLIEISTAPDIKDGAHLSEVAEKIGLILRTSGKVARGLGTIRQDVNISTDGGARVEIKGAQDLKLLPQLVENEVNRQLEIVRILNLLRNSGVMPLKKNTRDLSSLFKNTNAPLILSGLKNGYSIIAQKFPAHKSILGIQIQPGKRYGTELSDYAKRAGVKGIIHSDEDFAKYGISEQEFISIKKALDAADSDAFIMVVAPKDQAERAIDYALERANINGVPPETRRANPDATSSYMRPLPGRARLYPETDVPPIPLTNEILGSLEKGESLDDKIERLETLLNKDMATIMLKSRNLHLFDKLIVMGLDPIIVATTLENSVVSLRREGIDFSDLEKSMVELFSEYKKGTFVKAAIPEVLKYMAKGARVDAVIKVYRLQKITGKDLEKLVAENGCNVAVIMQKYRLQVDPAEVNEIAKRKRCEPSEYG